MLDEYEQWRRQNAGLYRDTSVGAFRDARDLFRLREQESDLLALLRDFEDRWDEIHVDDIYNVLGGAK